VQKLGRHAALHGYNAVPGPWEKAPVPSVRLAPAFVPKLRRAQRRSLGRKKLARQRAYPPRAVGLAGKERIQCPPVPSPRMANKPGRIPPDFAASGCAIDPAAGEAIPAQPRREQTRGNIGFAPKNRTATFRKSQNYSVVAGPGEPLGLVARGVILRSGTRCRRSCSRYPGRAFLRQIPAPV
jgi:hypothetical protein